MNTTAIAGVPRKSARKIVLAAGVLAIVAIIAGIVVLHEFWPFTESAIRSELASAASADVRFGSFQTKYFPPGCVALDVVFQRPGSDAPLAQIRRLTITSGLGGLLRRHVSLFKAEGMHVVLATRDFGNNHVRKQTTIDQFVADDAVLEVPRKTSEALKFVFHSFALKNLNGDGVTRFTAVFDNSLPPGKISTTGQFGPWNASDPSSTAVSGKYQLQNADLSAFNSIAGILSSDGSFGGTFKQMTVEGDTQTPNFVVASTGHGVPLDTHFSAIVDALNGDVALQKVAAHFGKDSITAKGSVARREDGKRSAILDLVCDHGRVEDTFYPFIHSPRSPLTGEIAFEMHVVLPSGHEPFLKKLQADSNFNIQNARFASRELETRVSLVSSPPNHDETQTSADFRGAVKLKNGIAHFTNFSAHDDAAAALLNGSYDLTDQKVNFHGKLKTEASLAKTTHGIKAVFAKAIEPFFKKKPHETVVPVHVGGTYSHPSFGLDLGS